MTNSKYLHVKNFERFQHYKDRAPVWIKLYNDLLDDYEFGCLPDASKWLAVGLWLLASRYENRIPNDPEWIARRINATDPVDISALVSAGFVGLCDDASGPLADCSGSAMPEKRREEKSKRENTNLLPTAAGGASVDLSPSSEAEASTEEPAQPPPPAAAPEAAPAPDRTALDDTISAVIRTANGAMAKNPAIDQQRFDPILTGHGSRQAVHDWITEGIPIDVITEAVEAAAIRYKPDRENRQISTMNYFNGAVRKAERQRQATTHGGTNGNGKRNDTRGVPAAGRGPARNSDPGRRSGFVYS